MFNFRMSIRENFASFRDDATGRVVLVDSFDNHEFNVRLGTLEESADLGVVVADNNDALNSKLRELVYAHL